MPIRLVRRIREPAPFFFGSPRAWKLLLVLFNLSAAAIGHPYWSIDGDANARWAQFIGFWKDIGLAGGALFLLARGAGRLSLDRKP
jgi:putative oxidoreductase